MMKSLPLVIFSQQQQLFALEASFVRSQGSVSFIDTRRELLSFSQLLNSELLNSELFKQEAYPCQHWLRVAGSQGRWLLGIEGDAELVELPAEQIYPLPPLLQASRQFKALQAVAWYQQRLVSVLDARVLLGLAIPLLTPAVLDASQGESLPNPAS